MPSANCSTAYCRSNARPGMRSSFTARPVALTDGPGDLLRRQARELLEQVPAVDLPAAMAFLEFLRDRGTADLSRPRSTPPKRPSTP